MSLTAWAAVRTLKVGGVGTNSSLIGSGTNDAGQLLLSLPVLVNVAVPTLTGFVIDKSSVVSAYGEVNVNTSDHRYFSSDSIGVRSTRRAGHNLLRPNVIGRFITAAGGS